MDRDRKSVLTADSSIRRVAAPLTLCVAAFLTASAQAPQPDGAGLERGVLPPAWTTGGSCPETPEFKLHQYNSDLVILRQSGCTNFEKPFLYLIFGQKTALLVDTGAKGADASVSVTSAMARWAERHGGQALPLLVVHSHGHGDHIASDDQLGRMPRTTLVPATVDAIERFFTFHRWPDEIVSYDLGERTIDIVPIPGHQPASLAIYDRRTGILLTGDTLYPGRLYVADPAAFTQSVDRLVAFTAGRPIAHILGAHIENTRTPYLDYPKGTTFQADEHALELGRAHLLELQAALHEMAARIERRAMRDFTIWPVQR